MSVVNSVEYGVQWLDSNGRSRNVVLVDCKEHAETAVEVIRKGTLDAVNAVYRRTTVTESNWEEIIFDE